MKASNFVLENYLKRIGYREEAKADLATLVAMMRCQLFTVPFENLDVQAGKIISLIPEEIVEKIVRRRRGGYCYEVNGLFAMALESLGIEYQFVAARPMFYPTRRPRTHMAVVASLAGEQWLCDLGFGSYGIRAPMKLNALDVAVEQDHDRFMLTKENERVYLLKALVDDQWEDQYAFDLSYHEWVDFMPANYVNSTHPESIFTRKILVVQHDTHGRTILFGNALKKITDGVVHKESLHPDEIDDILTNVFDLPRMAELRRRLPKYFRQED